MEFNKLLTTPTPWIFHVCVVAGDGFCFHDKTRTDRITEKEIALNEFPSPDGLWVKIKKHKGIKTEEVEKVAKQDYFQDRSDRNPRYYQQIAVNRTIEAIAKGQDPIILVMAIGGWVCA